MPFLTIKSLVSAPLLAAIVVVVAAATRSGEPPTSETSLASSTPLEALAESSRDGANLSRRVLAAARELDGPTQMRYLRNAFEQFPEIEGDVDLALLYLQSALAEGSAEDARIARDYLTASREWSGDESEMAAAAPSGA
jgi:hypothetical protein